MSLQSRGIGRVERGSKVNMGSSSQGVGSPKMSGMSPIVVRGDAMRAILPKGMDSGRVVDESTGGDSVSFRKMGIDAGM